MASTSAVCRVLQSGSAFAKFRVRWLLMHEILCLYNREPLVVSRPPDSKSEHPERLIHAALVPKLDQESICWSRQEHYDSNTLLRAVAETYPRARALALNTSKDFVFDEIGEIIHFEWRLPVVASPGFLPVAIFLPTTPLYIHPHFDGNTRCLRQRIVEALNDLLRWTRRDDTGLDRRRLKASSLMLTVHCGMTISPSHVHCQRLLRIIKESRGFLRTEIFKFSTSCFLPRSHTHTFSVFLSYLATLLTRT